MAWDEYEIVPGRITAAVCSNWNKTCLRWMNEANTDDLDLACKVNVAIDQLFLKPYCVRKSVENWIGAMLT